MSKNLVINCKTGETLLMDMTASEDNDRKERELAWSVERERPKPKTLEERIEALEALINKK